MYTLQVTDIQAMYRTSCLVGIAIVRLHHEACRRVCQSYRELQSQANNFMVVTLLEPHLMYTFVSFRHIAGSNVHKGSLAQHLPA
jgi:hypothetical protein